jgi:transposase, IS5 family
MKQMTLATRGFEKHGKASRRAQFLADMNRVVPWAQLCALIEPFYSKGTTGRPPVGVERMLRIYFLQNWFNLSDPAVEEALYDVISMREFVGIDLGNEPAPDETTILRFRHLLEKHGLGKRLFEEVGRHLQDQGMKLSTGTIVDATIISAPSSTKNKAGERDPEMRQTKKGNQWYFGMKAHIGTDSKTKLIHSVAVTGANVHDSQQLTHLLHGNERRVYGDAAYTGQTQTLRARAPKARDFTNEKGRANRPLTKAQRAKNRTKSRVRAKVEHAFGVIKRVFGFAKVRYRGLAKNANRVFVTAALANLFLARRYLIGLPQGSCV